MLWISSKILSHNLANTLRLGLEFPLVKQIASASFSHTDAPHGNFLQCGVKQLKGNNLLLMGFNAI